MMGDDTYKMNFCKEKYGIEYNISVFNFLNEFPTKNFDGGIIIKYLRYSYKGDFDVLVCIPYEKRFEYQKFLLSGDETDIPSGPGYPSKEELIVHLVEKSERKNIRNFYPWQK